MAFWIRHVVLLLLVVAGPVGTALWLDSETEVERARAAGARDARRAADALAARLTLEVKRFVDEALAAAHDLEDGELPDKLARGGARLEEARKAAEARLSAIRPVGGFAWLVDPSGQVVAGHSGPGVRNVGDHPLFIQSQLGYAGDTLWRWDEPVVWGASAPLASKGKAKGAVILGWPIDQVFVSGLAGALDVGLSLVNGGRVAYSSLPGDSPHDIIEPALSAGEPRMAGRLPEPLPSPVPGLPLFLGPWADGLAYTSMAVEVPGGALRWVVSVPATSTLEAVAHRQVNLLAGGLVLTMIVVLFALVSHRTYVRPIGQIAEHLSEIQLGRGELELSELRVSRPFRRLVRLVNMTIQRLPNRGLSALAATTPALSSTSRPAPSALPSSPAPSVPFGIGMQAGPPSAGRLRLDSVLSPGSEVSPKGASSSSPGSPTVKESGGPGAEAPATERRPPRASSPLGADEADIAKAIAALDAAPPPAKRPEREAVDEPAPRRSAAEIRGAMPQAQFGGLDDDFHEVSQFTLGPYQQQGARAAGGVSSPRAGGSLDFGLMQAAGLSSEPSQRPEGADATAVAPLAEELLAPPLLEEPGALRPPGDEKSQDMTVVATVDPQLLSQTISGPEEPDKNGLDDADWKHFRTVYEEFVALRRKCGEQPQDVAYDRFLAKLEKNRSKLIAKYNCRTVRFQVYEKEGRAALKATPVRGR